MLTFTRTTWNVTAPSSLTAGSGTVSPQSTSGETAAIIADADRLLGRAWSPRRLATWQSLLDQSLLGRAGRARAYGQWRRAMAKTGQM
jgi:hypothetical protein